MFLGHYAVAFAGTGAAPRANLGVLFAAAQLPDLIWPIFLLLGWERVAIEPGNTAFTPLDFVSYPISHSLLADVGWAIAAGAVYFALRRDERGALVVGLLVISHWILDWIVHAPDLPLIPGGETRAGLGLWDSVPATLLVEVLLLIAGLTIYTRITRGVDRVGRLGLVGLVLLLLVIYANNLVAPPPTDPMMLALFALSAALFPILAAYVDGRREVVSTI